MQKWKLFTHGFILATTPNLLAYPQDQNPSHVTFEILDYGYKQETEAWIYPNTYDEIIQMLEDLESGELERRYSPKELEKVNHYLILLAKQGILPHEFLEEQNLAEDTYDLMYGEDSAFQLTRYLEQSGQYRIFPAFLNGSSDYTLVQCGKISHAWKKTKKFVKEHKKEIIIGAVIVVAVAAVTVAVVVTSSAAVVSAASAGAAVAAGAVTSDASNPDFPEQTSSGSHFQAGTPDAPLFTSDFEEKISSFKEQLAQGNFFEQSAPGQSLSLEETGRVIGPLFAHESFNHFSNTLSRSPRFSQEMQNIVSHYQISFSSNSYDSPLSVGHYEIDQRFASQCGSLFSDPGKKLDTYALSYQMKGEAAHSYGYHTQAVQDFSKAITINPADPIPYLQRSSSYFELGQYDRAVEDFHHFAAQVENTVQKQEFSIPEFTIGFAKGLPKGVYESGRGTLLFLGDLVTHPIHTATQMYDALSTLAQLAREDQWSMIGEALSPELHQLITQWDLLPSDQRGELTGYAFGKHGTDLLVPGALAQIASKSAKAAQELTAVFKNLQLAEGTLVLETAAGIGNAAKVGEIVNAGKQTVFLGEELGFTAKEMGQLKQAGNLETTVAEAVDHLTPRMKESFELFQKAQTFLKPHKGFMPESQVRMLINQTGVKTFPRPWGIPENFRVKITKKGAGMHYVHPVNEQISIRVMPGKPHSSYPHQQKPYVIQMKDGKAFDKHGNLVPHESPEAHIPLEEFTYRRNS